MGKLLHPQVSQFVANYIADLAVDSSLTHFYREVHGITYGCNLSCVTNKYGIGGSAVVDNMFMFTVDVEQKNVDLALKLFKEQIPIIAASFTRQAFEDLSITFALTESKKQLYRMAPLGAFGTRQNFYAHNDIVQTDDIRALMSYIRDRFFNFENVAVEMNVLAAKVANGEFITVTSTN